MSQSERTDAPLATRSTRITWALGLAGWVVMLLALGWAALHRPSPGRLVQFAFEPAEGVAFDPAEDVVTISPDGRTLAFTGRAAGRRLLWVRSLDSLQARALPGSDGAREPFWSPDGRAIAFGAGGKLRRVDLDGARARVLAEAPELAGGAWSTEGVILFAPGPASPLFRVAAEGGASRPVTLLEPGARGHRSPSFLPGGRRFLFTAGTADAPRLLAGALDREGTIDVLSGAATARFAPPRWLLFTRGGELFAQPFDARRTKLSGEATRLARAGGAFSVSNDVLVCQPPGGLPVIVLGWRELTDR